MFEATLAPKTKSVLGRLGQLDFLKSFYLAGGTALALQLGHRQSIDLDFFSDQKFDNEKIKRALAPLGKLKIIAEEKDTLHVAVNNVLISFLYYPYPLLNKKILVDKIFLTPWQDIAAMKLSAIASRGSKKDFIDLYFILQKISLTELFSIFAKKYKGLDYSTGHLLKSLVYFPDADKEPLPKMLAKISWPKIKKEISALIKKTAG